MYSYSHASISISISIHRVLTINHHAPPIYSLRATVHSTAGTCLKRWLKQLHCAQDRGCGCLRSCTPHRPNRHWCGAEHGSAARLPPTTTTHCLLQAGRLVHVGRPQSQTGGRPQIQTGGRPQLQTGGRPQIQTGGRPHHWWVVPTVHVALHSALHCSERLKSYCTCSETKLMGAMHHKAFSVSGSGADMTN